MCARLIVLAKLPIHPITRNGQQQVVKEGQTGWVLQALISRAPSGGSRATVNPTSP